MRNLQKILALVLALMMSVSLVATAGAFSDDGDITDVYKDAVTVLNGLDVFKGYNNGATFQPKGNITRAEVAAIIYRIATGDVTDSQASIYSTYGQFTDVADGSWYSGYVNYCANAGYIKGRGNKIFDPQGQVTGYEALAMILRAVGYDKNGEFTGSNWQIRTASIANERGITKNVTSAQLGQAATRETVAEILFRSIVIPKVNFNANTLSYTEKPLNADGKKDTLGYESLKLEEITGIVTANEYADLDNSVTLNADKTRMRVSGVDGGNYILDYGEATLLEGLDAIGEEHNAYIQNANTTSAKVLLMAKTDNNKTYETLEKVEIDTDSKFREKTGLQRSETATEHYLNFDEVKDWRSDWRIKYVISSVNTVANTIDEVNREISRINANTNFELPTLANLNADTLARAGYALIPDGTTGRFFIEYTKEFRVDTTIGSVDRGNIEEIFNIADRLTKNDYVRGEVYVGTSSLKDISDEISYKQFVEQYINNDGDKKITKNENGNWLKVIDNDNDGQADYVLKVVYTMAQVVRASGGEYGLDTEDLSLNDGDEVNYLDDDDAVSEDTLVLDDIVYYAVIDGVPRATKAESATVKIDTVNRKDLRVTTTDSVEYVESGVHGNHVVSPDYTCGVTNMNGSATYDIYLDRGGYLALFTDSHGGDFTLIVDGWYNSTKGGIEYAVRAYNDETGRQDVVDVTRGGGMFIGRDVQWTDQVDNNDWRALKWLGGTNGTEALTNRDTATGTYGAGKLNGEGYATTNDVKTTVATLTDDGMIQPVDYTSVGSKVVRMLATKDNEIPDSSASYQAEVYTTGSSLNTTDTAYNRPVSGDAELRALSTTVYYLVYPSKNAESGFAVEKYTGYASVPSVDDAFIEDVYAVATRQDRTSTLGGRTYYTADVVVVELKSTFRGYAEQVFIYNMPEAGNRVGIESVDLIHENGENETGVKIDFALSNVRDYRVAHDVNSSLWKTTHWRPGLYYLYPTNTADLYTVQPMTADDIAQNDYVVGWSSTSDATAKTDHVSVIAFSNDNDGGDDIAYGEVTKAVSNVYRIGYDSKGIADLSTYKLDEGNLLSFVDERVDVTSGVNTYDYNKYDHYPYDRENHPNACDICWNQNLILMHYTGNTANYTISFKNDNSLAEDVWSNNMPSTLAWNDATDTNKNLSRDDAVSYAQFMLKCADPVNDANGLPTNVYYNARYHIDQNVMNSMAGTLEVKKNRVDSVADNLITQLKGTTPVEYTVSVNVTVDGVAVPAAEVATYVTGTGTVAAGSAYTLTLTDAALAYDVSVDGTAHTGSTITGTANSNVTHTIALTTKTPTTDTWTVTATLTNVTADPAILATVADKGTVTTTLTAAAGYNLPATVTVTIGGTAAVAGTDYTYDSTTGALTISNVSGNVEITVGGVAETVESVVIKLTYTNDLAYTKELEKTADENGNISLTLAELWPAPDGVVVPQFNVSSITGTGFTAAEDAVTGNWTLKITDDTLTNLELVIDWNTTGGWSRSVARSARSARAAGDIQYWRVNYPQGTVPPETVEAYSNSFGDFTVLVDQITSMEIPGTNMVRWTIPVEEGANFDPDHSYLAYAPIVQPSGEEVTVTVEKDTDVSLVRRNPQTNLRQVVADSSYQETAYVGETVTVVVEVGSTDVPYVVGNSAVAFQKTSLSNGESMTAGSGYAWWTADVPVTQDKQVIKVGVQTGVTYATLTLTAKPGVEITSPTPTNGSVTFTTTKGTSDTYYADVTLTVKVTGNKVPRVDASASGLNGEAVASYAVADATTNTWTITLSEISDSVTADINVIDIPEVIMIPSDDTKVRFEGSTPNRYVTTVPTGTMEVIVYVAGDQAPVFSSNDGYTVKLEKLPKTSETPKDMTGWKATLSGINNSGTITVSASDLFEITLDPKANCTLVKPTETKLKAINGTISFEVWVNENFTLTEDCVDYQYSTLNKADLTLTWDKITNYENNRTKWTITVSGVTDDDTLIITPEQGYIVKMISDSTHATVPAEETVAIVADSVGTHTFKVNIDNGFAPTAMKDEDGNEVEGAVAANADGSWNVTVKNITAAVDAHLAISPLPYVNITCRTGASSVPPQLPTTWTKVTGTSEKYSATFNIKLDKGYELGGNWISVVRRWQDGTNGTVTTHSMTEVLSFSGNREFTVEKVPLGDNEWKVTITINNKSIGKNGTMPLFNAKDSFGDITPYPTINLDVTITPRATYMVELTTGDAHIKEIVADATNPNPRPVKDGDVHFTVLTDSGWRPVATTVPFGCTDVKVDKQGDGVYDVVVMGVTRDVTVDLKSAVEPTTIPNFEISRGKANGMTSVMKVEVDSDQASKTGAGTGVVSGGDTLSAGTPFVNSLKAGGNRLTLTVTVDYGYIPVAKVSPLNVDGSDPVEVMPDAWSVKANTAGSADWTIDITDITGDFRVVLDTEPFIDGLGDSNEVILVDKGHIDTYASEITVAADTTALGAGNSGQYVVTLASGAQSYIEDDNSKEMIRFVVFVRDGYTLTKGAIGGTGAAKITGVSVDDYTGAGLSTEVSGYETAYRPMQVTLTIDNNPSYTASNETIALNVVKN